ncbi:helix-turn-helix transcriptional regulator [Alcaligenes endophyticus]|uniref:AlpA family transcriptional regulator n=1 Tax=Alcaligenes endophyticus TaxID=1929088 RepID=A0ABT8EKD0_9BURK|nr:AlpA family phage regulatory protein [Alcaligenes endophyticus]MCX5590883.1 AlpA family phage regulatory protein [Alcaligenes endophyticus]MDN4121754.1 AlpA family transcriptional regulator [Alcaligenes endophyticus]
MNTTTPWSLAVSQIKQATEPSRTATIQPMLYRMKDLPARIGISRSQIYKLIQRGEFPRPVSLGGASVAWRSEDIEAWKANLHPI